MPTKTQVENFLAARYDYWEIDEAPQAPPGPTRFSSSDVGYYYARGVKYGNDNRTAQVDAFRLIRVGTEWRSLGQVSADGSVTGTPF